MTEIDRGKLAAMDDSALRERHADLETIWKRLERKSDPDGTYTDRQRSIEEEQRVIMEILGSRRAAEGQTS